jgi:lipopolysaccharide export system protein LptA
LQSEKIKPEVNQGTLKKMQLRGRCKNYVTYNSVCYKSEINPISKVANQIFQVQLIKSARTGVHQALYCAVICMLAASMIWAVSIARAERSDRDQPMHIEADAMRYEDSRDKQPQVATFTGGVVVTKGTILMRGDKLVVKQDSTGGQAGVITPAAGKRAFFRQKRDGVNEFIEGEANRMEYDSKSDTVHLIGDAEMRRLIGNTMADNVRGDLIVYNDRTEVYTANSAPAVSNNKPGSGRIHAILAPKSTTDAGTKKTESAASPASVTLRSSGAALAPAKKSPTSAPAVTTPDASDQGQN